MSKVTSTPPEKKKKKETLSLPEVFNKLFLLTI